MDAMSSKTEFADVSFKASDNEGSPQYIGTRENGPPTNTILHDKLDFRLRLKPGIDYDDAVEITR